LGRTLGKVEGRGFYDRPRTFGLTSWAVTRPSEEGSLLSGGGLSGCEAAWQIAERGIKVRLYEMRPVRPTPAHKTSHLAEIVCSNSLKSDQPFNASWLLKQELRRMGSLLMRIADSVRVPAGSALAVDREEFAMKTTEAINGHTNIELVREEVTEIPGLDDGGIVIIASGPLTSGPLSESIRKFCGVENLYFYDAISPIVDAETIDYSKAYRASRYGKGDDDYINCPMSQAEYSTFYDALVTAEAVELHDFEEAHYFESCLPIEELARRGRETLRLGPMRPVGLIDPHTGRMPWAVVQLRQEDRMQSSYNLVGFQNHLKFPDQRRILRLIRFGAREFLRLGQIHEPINAPMMLTQLWLRGVTREFAGQLLAGRLKTSLPAWLGINAYTAAVSPCLSSGNGNWGAMPVYFDTDETLCADEHSLRLAATDGATGGNGQSIKTKRTTAGGALNSSKQFAGGGTA
jgi:methylenetetrahydrofolate--tRNA-(uracil-5-)-methyltransferase